MVLMTVQWTASCDSPRVPTLVTSCDSPVVVFKISFVVNRNTLVRVSSWSCDLSWTMSSTKRSATTL